MSWARGELRSALLMIKFITFINRTVVITPKHTKSKTNLRLFLYFRAISLVNWLLNSPLHNYLYVIFSIYWTYFPLLKPLNRFAYILFFANSNIIIIYSINSRKVNFACPFFGKLLYLL